MISLPHRHLSVPQHAHEKPSRIPRHPLYTFDLSDGSKPLSAWRSLPFHPIGILLFFLNKKNYRHNGIFHYVNIVDLKKIIFFFFVFFVKSNVFHLFFLRNGYFCRISCSNQTYKGIRVRNLKNFSY